MLRKFIHIFRETFKHPEHPKRHQAPEQKGEQSTQSSEAAEPHSMTKEEKLNEALKDSFPASDPISTGR